MSFTEGGYDINQFPVEADRRVNHPKKNKEVFGRSLTTEKWERIMRALKSDQVESPKNVPYRTIRRWKQM